MAEAGFGGNRGAGLRMGAKAWLSTAAILLCLAPATAQQGAPSSSLTLAQAVKIALEKNPQRKAVLADTKAAVADLREARSSLMPRLEFSEAATRGDDPVYVFGSRLRQQRFTVADFALNNLNTPLPISNFTTRFAGTWNLFDSFATWHQIARAKLMNLAAAERLGRADQQIIYQVINAYYALLLAAKRLQVAEQSSKTAEAITNQSQARFDSGLVVESDLLTAKVRAAERREAEIRARSDVEMARAQLNMAMGVAVDSSFQPSESLAERTLPVPVLGDLEKQALANRPDLNGVAAEEAAQRQSVAAAKSSFGPRVNAFAGWELDNPTFVAGGGGNNWLGGIEVQFDLFQGGAKRAELARQGALEEKAAALKQAARDEVQLEVRRAYYDEEASRQQIEVARAATAQAQESFRISRDRYDNGLVTITDLLSGEDAVRRSQTDYWDAIYRYQTSYANLDLASGTLSAQSPVVLP
ncbi:MAG TPA: TolC family protein [Terriglobales bacterium]|nr:TolC family protein [Terriglobales bacterium]